MNSATFDTLSAARSLEAAGMKPEQAEAIVQAIRSSGESTVTKADLSTATDQLRAEINAATAQLRAEINSAVNKMLLAQIAVAGLLFAALKIFG